jgi:hypothetical protein
VANARAERLSRVDNLGSLVSEGQQGLMSALNETAEMDEWEQKNSPDAKYSIFGCL